MGDKVSPLDAEHRRLGAKMSPFGGWSMPIHYPDGTLAEHRACRDGAVVFDVSHLGTVRVSGPGAVAHLQNTLTNDLDKIGPGRCQYTHLLDDDGWVLDDIIVWWRSDELFDVMPNASNTDRVVDALTAGSVDAVDVTDTRAVLAVQGPEALRRLHERWPDATVGRFAVRDIELDGVAVTIAGTGYTGEEGVELAIANRDAATVWRSLLDLGIVAAGLGARDTLRLEAGLPLFGHELGEGRGPLEAGLGWVVGWDKPVFCGRDAVMRRRDAGVDEALVGLRTDTRRPPRQGDVVTDADGLKLGVVTSGNFSPVLGVGIAMAYLPSGRVAGERLAIVGRSATLDATLVELPFVGR